MDEEDELSKLKWILFAGVAFLVSGYFSFQELKFTIWGTTAEAEVTRTFETRNTRRGGTLLAVEYTFKDKEGKYHSERDDIPSSSPTPGPKVTIQYLPGVEDSSRLEGHSSRTAVLIFFGCCAWLAYSGYQLYQLASEAVDGPPRRRKR